MHPIALRVDSLMRDLIFFCVYMSSYKKIPTLVLLFHPTPLQMKKEDTPQRPAERLVFKTMSGIRILSPDRIIYIGYIKEENSKKCMQLTYLSVNRDRVHSEQLCYRSLRSLRLPESGRIMQVHRRALVPQGVHQRGGG